MDPHTLPPISLRTRLSLTHRPPLLPLPERACSTVALAAFEGLNHPIIFLGIERTQRETPVEQARSFHVLTTARAQPCPPRVIDGRYRVHGILGHGRFGVVHEAVELETGRLVAIRIAHPHLVGDARSFATRFFAEGARRVQLIHPHTLRVHDYGRTGDDAFFMVMELVRGRSLSRVLSARGAVDPALATQLCLRVCASVSHAHAQGVVHGQLSPDLVWLTGRGLSGLKVVGYGNPALRGRAELHVWEPRHARYAAPEQLSGEPASPASDVFSVGLLLFELLTGRPAFPEESAVRVLLSQRQEAATSGPWFGRLCATAPALARIIDRCLSSRPADRYGSVAELERALIRQQALIAA